MRPNVYAATAADGQVALVHSARWGEQVGTLTVGEQEMLRELAATQHTEPGMNDVPLTTRRVLSLFVRMANRDVEHTRKYTPGRIAYC